MLQVRSVKYNFIMNVILTASTIIFPLVTFPYISRILLPAGVGKVNFATSVVSYFSMFAMLGVPTYGIRACAQVRDDREELSRTVQEILILNILVSCFVYLLYFLAVWNVPRLRADSSLFLVVSGTIFFNVIGVEWLYRGLEQYSYIAMRSIAFKILGLILMFLFVNDQQDYVIYGAISIVASVGSNLLNFLNLKKYVDIYPVGNYHISRHLRAVFVFFLMAVATTIYTNLDTVMLGFMKEDVEVGFYTAAVKVKNLLVSLVTALSAVLLPRVSYYIEHKMQDEFMKMSQKALNFVLFISIPVTVYFMFFAKESILLLSGEEFAGAVTPMQIILPTVVFIGLTNVMGIQMLVPLGCEKQVFYSVLTGAIVDLFVNVLCIPKYASSGAAFGTVLAEISVLIVQIMILRSKIKIFDMLKKIQIHKLVFSAVVGIFSCIWIKWTGLHCIVILGISCIIFFSVYAVCLLILKDVFMMEQFALLKTMIKKKCVKRNK